jgi:hypothetical protein
MRRFMTVPMAGLLALALAAPVAAGPNVGNFSSSATIAEASWDSYDEHTETLRSQSVNATTLASASDGFIQPSVCRGRPFSSRATASRWAWSWTERSVPFGKY